MDERFPGSLKKGQRSFSSAAAKVKSHFSPWMAWRFHPFEEEC
jgi:hypothetical protein